MKILSIDGGGIRGIIPAIILAEIENRLGKPIAELFDLIAGTSTGGILAVGLTKPYPLNPQQPQYDAEDLVKMYREEGDRIFYEPLHERFTKVDDLMKPKYSSAGRGEILEEYLRDVTLEKALTSVMLTSYDIELRMPIFFVSDRSSEIIGEGFRKIGTGFTMKQAAMATSAAPTFFEPYHLPTVQAKSGFYTLVDGGVVANNPTSLAIMETIISSKKAGDKLDIDEILVVSLGTGSLTRRYPYEEARNWGLISWAEPIVNILMDVNSESVASQLEQLLPPMQGYPKKYYRFQVPLTEANDDMDDASPKNIKNLEKLAHQLIAEKHYEIDSLCEMLK
ncbi:patatin-like phospholipase family protein [Aerosakkonema sp. BLCC-F183]|uniref:patatin-like phospholipase family protein n=1 Tax=Aerosakkonema sp. BLCC-F183 TaxID=3342834 RepID=UPI0035BA42F7